jgi:hypothetical protein
MNAKDRRPIKKKSHDDARAAVGIQRDANMVLQDAKAWIAPWRVSR